MNINHSLPAHRMGYMHILSLNIGYIPALCFRKYVHIMKFHDTYPVFPFIFMLQVEMCSCGFFSLSLVAKTPLPIKNISRCVNVIFHINGVTFYGIKVQEF
jgi:hypothetical protein